jgi:hypothetical protein
MNKIEKKELVQRLIANGDTRSYNQLMADLELQIWTKKQKGEPFMRKSLKDSYLLESND